MTNKRSDYEVGFRKPPKQHRFQKGRSGNPAGRPKRAPQIPDVVAVLAEELSAKVTINENGERITKFQALCRQLVNRAAKGDHAAAALLTKWIRLVSQTAEQEQQAGERSTQEIEAELNAMLDAMSAKLATN